MVDGLEITASIIAVLQLTNEVIKYGLDFADAPKAIVSLREGLKSLQVLLKQLNSRYESAKRQETSPPWLQSLKRFVPDLREAIEEAMTKLMPKKQWMNTKAYQRITWHFWKDKLDEICNTISHYLIAINVILALKYDETIEGTRDLVKEGIEHNKV